MSADGFVLVHSVPQPGALAIVPYVPHQFGCNLTSSCQSYAYKNEELRFTAVLQLMNGQVSFSSFSSTTPWHGAYTLEPYRLVLTFHHLGNVAHMKTCVLYKVAEGRYRGLDYCGRVITPEARLLLRWCTTCNAWHEQPTHVTDLA